MNDIYKRAAKKALRFASTKGSLMVEDLFVLSLESLDTLAKKVNKELKEESEESFIKEKSVKNTELTLKLDILKDVIETKLKEKEALIARQATLEKKGKIEEILARKRDADLETKSEEELLKMLEG